MSIKKEFHTISISIPSELVNVSKGKVSSVKSLTKSGNLTTKEGKKSVILETNKGNDVIVKNEGRMIDTKEEKKKAKDRKERAKNISEEELNKIFKEYKKPEFMTPKELEDYINNGSLSKMKLFKKVNKNTSVKLKGLPKQKN